MTLNKENNMATKKTTHPKQTANQIDLAKEVDRLNAREKKLLMKEAKSLVGKWSTSGDGMYYHIDKIMKILDDDVTNLFVSKVTFVVRSDECICMDSGMIAIDPGLKQKLNISLFAPDEMQLTTDEVMKMLDENLANVIEGYKQACERHNHKPIKVKVGKRA